MFSHSIAELGLFFEKHSKLAPHIPVLLKYGIIIFEITVIKLRWIGFYLNIFKSRRIVYVEKNINCRHFTI